MRPFWKRLMAKSYQLQKPFSFAVYSLGDSSYGDHFAMAARKLRQRLKMLGAQEFVEIGLGDDMEK
jgi:sulfite reductase alpha subunit-like flavoprotein